MLPVVSIRLLNLTTTGTLLRGIASVNRLNGYTPLLRLVLQNTSEAGECPVGEASVHRAALVTLDTFKVFENDNSNIIAVFKYRLHGAVEKVIPEAVLTSRERLQSLPTRRCAFGVQFSTAKSCLRRAMVQLTASNELPVRGYGEVSDTLIDTENPTLFSLLRCVLGDAYIEIPATISFDKFGTQDIPCSIEELQLVVGQFDVYVDAVSKSGERDVVLRHLRGATIERDSGLSEHWLSLSLLSLAGTCLASLQCPRHNLKCSTNMVRLQQREVFANVVITEIVNAICRELFCFPSNGGDLIEHTHEDIRKFRELFVVLITEFNGNCSFYVIYEYTCLKDDCKGERLVSSVA